MVIFHRGTWIVPKFLGALFFGILSFSSAHAADRMPSSIGPSRQGMDHDFQANLSGRALSQKDVIFRSLLGTRGKDLDWPNFPRTWHEESESEVMATNTAIGLSLAGGGGGVSIDYKWSLKTSLVIIASNRSAHSAMDDNQVTVEPVDALQFSIFRWDAASHRSLPNVSKEYPMVAFCAFEASLNYSKSARTGFAFLGSGQSVEGAQVHSISHTMFSRFFQLDGTRSPIQLLDEVCTQKFRPAVESYVQTDFSQTVAEMFAYQHPANECQPEASQDGVNGDVDCQNWFHKTVDAPLQHLTVPRCVLQRNGIHRCEIRSREGRSCRMYWDADTRMAISSEQVQPGRYYPRATSSELEFPCDQKAGLTCELSSQPTILLNVPVWRGSASCVSKTRNWLAGNPAK